MTRISIISLISLRCFPGDISTNCSLSIQNLNYIFFTDTQTALSSTMKTDIKYVSTSNTHWLCLLLQFFFLWSNPSLLLQPFSFQISIEYCRMSLSTCCCFSTLTLIFFISIFFNIVSVLCVINPILAYINIWNLSYAVFYFTLLCFSAIVLSFSCSSYPL